MEQLPERGTLAKLLESNEVVRNRLLCGGGKLTSWSSPSAVGCKSVKNMSLNFQLLEIIAHWWCPSYQYAKALTIDLMRGEASIGQSLVYRSYRKCISPSKNTCRVFKP